MGAIALVDDRPRAVATSGCRDRRFAPARAGVGHVRRDAGAASRTDDAHANAEVMVTVDANGNLLNTKLVAESSKNGGWGDMLVKAMSGAKFIPASNNGKPEQGEFTWAVRYNETYDPDHVRTGSHVRHESE